jgi:hypothetical protein
VVWSGERKSASRGAGEKREYKQGEKRREEREQEQEQEQEKRAGGGVVRNPSLNLGIFLI